MVHESTFGLFLLGWFALQLAQSGAFVGLGNATLGHRIRKRSVQRIGEHCSETGIGIVHNDALATPRVAPLVLVAEGVISGDLG